MDEMKIEASGGANQGGRRLYDCAVSDGSVENFMQC